MFQNSQEFPPNSIPTSSWRHRNKPRLIVLIRHGESQSNKDKLVNEYTPNHLVPLTAKGWKQAKYAGIQLLKALNVDDEDIVDRLEKKYKCEANLGQELPISNYKKLNKKKDLDIVFYTSPYIRTRETLKGILDVIDEYNELNSGLKIPEEYRYEPCNKKKSAAWHQKFSTGVEETEELFKSNEGSFEKATDIKEGGSAFESQEVPASVNDDSICNKINTENGKTFIRYRIKDDPRIREQDFGNFQQVTSMEDVMTKRKHYGHFFFRFPQGESAADVYDRVASFQETLFRFFERNILRKPRDVVVLVSHGIYCRVFLMKWFRWTYEEFESFTNVPNGSLMIMELDESIDRYVLRTELPRWCQ
ncbi:hypothetical protein TPHA_0A03950 [Tetrapisispora phaffii CBS 4417]|uniref:Uncharacterized protein n=1 Tax=Tetrapisispora phaffii (strain ATCC 24235 / CBS 4417 / NBRC 1672 / NRRL Y-8282 / UCD 70-5) TaxID=1071381 RepID=G8BNJ3_TETPH|nr:hypothetical protein TPHA_0A03950 [Tetrapisispora phaffii CBS 4417]CCE61471.1 hypothetical protein TPHA_0A03950 [Tetrapisispora phaffii CBS 4417]